MKLPFSFTILAILIVQFAFSQEYVNGKTEQQVEENAFSFFDAEEYQQAMPFYEQLHDVYPYDPEYNYYLGVCKVELNVDLLSAIEHLKVAENKKISNSVYYYLGRAFHMTYQFNSAIRYYRKFCEKYKKKAEGIERLIEMCHNGLSLVNTYYVIPTQKKTIIERSEFFHNYDIEGFEDRLLVKTKYLQSKNDGSGDKDIAVLAKRSRYVYFSSYGKNKKNGRDLYRVKRLTDGNWGEWEALTSLNTKYDELYPFMANDDKTLYFCSQGHSSMGGFDIFKSIYNDITDTWSEPENLGFPFNSTANDLFFATDVNDEHACFTSSRETGKKLLTVYKVKLNEEPEIKVVLNKKSLPDLAILNAEIISKADVPEQKLPLDLPAYICKYKADNFPYFNLKINDQLIYHFLVEFKSGEACHVFREAKNDEFNADSLQTLSENLQLELEEMKETQKATLQQMIGKIQKRSQDLKEEAAKKIIQAQKIESDYLNKHIAVNNQYKTGDQQPKKEILIMTSEVLPKAKTVGKVEIISKTRKVKGYEYRIQVGVFSVPQTKDFFAGLPMLLEETIDNGSMYKYMVGSYPRFSIAKEAIQEVRQTFPNSFIIAYKDGKKVSLAMAVKITDQEYSHDSMDEEEKFREKYSDIIFKVQIGAYAEEVPKDVEEKLKAFSKYKIEFSKDYRNYTICTVGNFESYSKVCKLKVELREGGLKDAFTVAYSGKDRITIQQALEILRQ